MGQLELGQQKLVRVLRTERVVRCSSDHGCSSCILCHSLCWLMHTRGVQGLTAARAVASRMDERATIQRPAGSDRGSSLAHHSRLF